MAQQSLLANSNLFFIFKACYTVFVEIANLGGIGDISYLVATKMGLVGPNFS